MGIQAPAQVKYSLIRETLQSDNNLLSITLLCQIAGVSRSGFYGWMESASLRRERDDADRNDFELVLEAYRFRGYAKGARSIHMRLLHVGIRMNVKKIRRLMGKFNLLCPIRRANPYRQMARAMQTNTIAPNLVDRQFRVRGVRKNLLTDITYLFYKNGRCYLSTILDACTHEVLAGELSEDLHVEFVLETVDLLVKEHGSALDSTTIVHSDQGYHYTSRAFIEKLKDNEFVQSMSRKGNCWDNAPQESFFGHMKDEINEKIAACETFEDVRAVVEDWLDYYNKDRYQWDLLKLSPHEYYGYLMTGIYPLPQYQKD